MDKIYFVIPALALFSDLLLKRFISGNWAVATQYGLAVIVLVWISLANRNKEVPRPSATASRMNFFVYYLIIAYCIAAMTSFNVPLSYSLTHVLYICIPLLYIPVISRRCAEFDMAKLINIFLLLMIPINIAGLIQYTIDPGFLISAAYNEEGGIVFHNSYQDIFLRYPSIFVSADRYSAVGLVQFYFAIILLWASTNKTRNMRRWIYFNLISSVAALIIAGARSRMFIILLLIILMGLSVLLYRTPLLSLRTIYKKSARARLIILTVGIFIIVYGSGLLKRLEDFPALGFFITSIREGDAKDRVQDYISESAVSGEISLAGEGLGSLGLGGKPAERGITSLWIECGLIGGSLILIGFCGITFILALQSLRAFIRGRPVEVCIFALPAMVLVAGLLAGLTAVFELSLGILLMCAIAGVIKQLPLSADHGVQTRFVRG